MKKEVSIQQWYELVQQGLLCSVEIVLAGSSMQPLIRRNHDIVTIVPVNRPLRRGDVVLLRRSDGVYVGHRICSIKKASCQTLGDRCLRKDAPISISDVLGLAEIVKKDGKSIFPNRGSLRILGLLWLHTTPFRKYLISLYHALK